MHSPRVGIGVLIFNGQNLLLGKRKSAHGTATWGPPGGHLEFGESFEVCAIREVKEETGLVITSPKLLIVTNDIFEKENKHYVSIFLHAQYPKEQVIRNLEPEKVISWEWIKVSCLPDNLFLPLKNLIEENGKQFLLTLAESRHNGVKNLCANPA